MTKIKFGDTLLLYKMWVAVTFKDYNPELFWIVLNYSWICKHSKDEAIKIRSKLEELDQFFG